MDIMNNTPTVDEITLPGRWLASSAPDSRWLRRQVDQLLATVPDTYASPARVLLEEAALSYSRALESGTGLSPQSGTRVRAAAESWAATGIPLDWMVREFGELTTRLADLLMGQQGVTVRQVRNVLTADNNLMREFLAGANRWHSRARAERNVRGTGDLVADLIAGRELAAEDESQLANAYLVAVVDLQEYVSVPQFGRTVRKRGGRGTLIGASAEFVALIPDSDPRHTHQVVQELEQQLNGQARVGAARCERAAIRDGYREAADILRLVGAAGRAPGVYWLEDCLVEYAVSRNDTVAESLLSVLTPLTDHPVLWETLEALTRADFNRNDAAKHMFVHRSTLDYRLRRIEQMTGYNPTTSRGAQVLSAAMTLHAVARSSALTQRDEGSPLRWPAGRKAAAEAASHLTLSPRSPHPPARIPRSGSTRPGGQSAYTPPPASTCA
jgi:sugar diacid utilization regulator